MADRLIHQPANPDVDVPILSRRRRRALAGAMALLGVLVLFLAWTQTGWFARSVILQRLEDMHDIRVEADTFRLSGWRTLIGRSVEVRDDSDRVVFKSRELECQFSLLEFLSGARRLDALKLNGAEWFRHETARSSRPWNVWLTESRFEGASGGARLLPRWELRDVSMADSRVRFTWDAYPEASVEVGSLALASERLVVDEEANLEVAAEIQLVAGDNRVTIPLEGQIGVNLSGSGIPQFLSGGVSFGFQEASGYLAHLDGASGRLDLAMDQGEVKDSGVELTKGGESLGAIRVSGPFDSRRNEGRLRVTGTGIDRHWLNVIGAIRQIDFRESRLQWDSTLDWSVGGTVFSARGKVKATDLEMVSSGGQTPVSDVEADYAFQHNFETQSLLLQKCRFGAVHGEEEWLSGVLDSPVILSWGSSRPGIKEPTFRLQLKEVDLAQWGPLLSQPAIDGVLSVSFDATVRRDGRLITSDVTGSISKLPITYGGDSFLTHLSFDCSAKLEELKRVNLVNIRYELFPDGQAPESRFGAGPTILSGDGAFSFQFDDLNYSVQLASRGDLPSLTDRGWVPGLELSQGNFDLLVRIQANELDTEVFCNTILADVTGRYQNVELEDYRFEIKCDGAVNERRVLVNSVSLDSRRNYNEAGSVSLTGNYDLQTKASKFQLRTVGLNRHWFRPFAHEYGDLAVWEGAELRLDCRIDSTVEGGSVTGRADLVNLKLVESEEDSSLLDSAWDFNATWSEDAIELKPSKLILAVTERAVNEVRIAGESKINAGLLESAALQVSSDGVDLSDYFTFFRRIQGELEADDSVSTSLPVDTASTEVTLPGLSPVPAVSLGLELDQLYMGEIAMTNVVGTLGWSGPKFSVAGLKTEVNGGTFELNGTTTAAEGGVSDVKWDLAGSEIALEPILRTFDDPEDVAGGGRLSFSGQVNGALDRSAAAAHVLDGGLTVSIEEPTFLNLDSELLSWLNPILTTMQLPSSDTWTLRRLSGDFQFQGKNLVAERVELDSSHLRMRTQGSVPLRAELLASPVDLPVDVFLVPSGGGLTNAGEWPSMAPFATLEGPLDDLEIRVDPLALAQALVDAKGPGSGAVGAER